MSVHCKRRWNNVSLKRFPSSITSHINDQLIIKVHKNSMIFYDNFIQTITLMQDKYLKVKTTEKIIYLILSNVPLSKNIPWNFPNVVHIGMKKKQISLHCRAEMRFYKQSRRIIIRNKRLFDKIPSSAEVRCLGSEALPADWIILLFKQKRCLAHKSKVRKFNV